MSTLAQQPLFRLLGAIIVLLTTEMNPIYGMGAGMIWLIWVGSGTRIFFRGIH